MFSSLYGLTLLRTWQLPFSGLLDLDLVDLPDCAEQLHVSAKHLGDWVADQRPDLLLLVTHQVIQAAFTGSANLVVARELACPTVLL